MLLGWGAEIDSVDGSYGWSALHHACDYEVSDVACADILLSHGAAVNLAAADGGTALHVACGRSHP